MPGAVVSTPGRAPLLPAGWIRVDCHLHTVRSGDACTKLDELEERVESAGLDVVCITDHHAIDAAEEALTRDLGVRVIVGEEIGHRSANSSAYFSGSESPTCFRSTRW